jgi:hypothetical protein
MYAKLQNILIKLSSERTFTRIRLIITVGLLIAALIFPEIAQAGPSSGGVR